MARILLYLHLAIGTVVSLLVLVYGATDPQDVAALSSLYASLDKPSQLTNWSENGGDPCGENWLGVICSKTNVTELRLNRKGLSGTLGFSLNEFQGLLTFDISNNNLGGNLPYQLPIFVEKLNLAGNQFTGDIPYSLQQLTNLTYLDLSYNMLQNLIPDLWTSLTSLRILDLSFNQLTGPLPSSMGDLSALTYLNVGNNELNGTLPLTLSNLTSLQYLNLENNEFTGWLPPNLNPPELRTGGNNFSTASATAPPFRLPPAPRQPKPLSPRRTPPGFTNQAGASGDKVPSGKSSFWTGGRIAGISIMVALLVVLAAVLGVLLMIWRKRGVRKTDEERLQGGRRTWLRPPISPILRGKWGPSNPNSGEVGARTGGDKKARSPPEISKKSPLLKTLATPSLKTFGEIGPSRPAPSRRAPTRTAKVMVPATAYSVADLQAATNSFAQENLIGEGSLGHVYRGEFPDGQVFAVKKLETSSPLVQNEGDFLGILASIARLRHPNITELVGYCAEHGQRLLVFQFVSRGTLADILHTPAETTNRLSWNERVRIALGAARALEYLHEVCLPAVVHRNLKSANVLLDDEHNPYVTDCGMAALTPFGSDRQVSLQMLGSFGYSAPEYAMSGIYTVKSDVYSFGVVMLELLTGRKTVDSTRPRAEHSLVRWATPQLHDIDALAHMVDPVLKGTCAAKSLSRFADVIALCVQPEPEFRPPISEVVQALMRMMQRPNLKTPTFGDEGGASNCGPSDS